ncbi:MAG: GNAT family N-acetyltransferase [Rhodopila sp.]|nr:GNAT family N-acetyltransferase [Rhodopila sp.]
MAWSVAAFDHLAELPPAAEALFADPSTGSLFATRDWYRCIIDTALPEAARPCFVLCQQDGQPRALFPMERHTDGMLQSLTTPYTCLYQPLIAAGAHADALFQIGRSFARFCRSRGAIRIEALDRDWPGLQPLLHGLRSAGLVPLRFDHFGNWHEPIPGETWDSYLRSRDGALRETVRRKLGKALRDKDIRFDPITGGPELEAGIAAFEDVYARSWKEPEPFLNFNAGFMRAAAAMGILRLGVMRLAGQPIAAQYWVITGKTGSVLKLAHDETFKPISPGTVLTALMIRSLLEDDGVTELDFGRGDDPYKRQWVGKRRQRIGLIIANPFRPSGLRRILTHLAGRARQKLRAT